MRIAWSDDELLIFECIVIIFRVLTITLCLSQLKTKLRLILQRTATKGHWMLYIGYLSPFLVLQFG